MSDQIHRITQATLEKLQAELEHLTTVGRVQIARTIEAARALGDLKENGEYHAAKDDQGKMELRILVIEQILNNHEIVERDANAGVIGHASIVTIKYDGDRDEDAEEYFIGSMEEKPEGMTTISPLSPLGEHLLGKAVGDTVTFPAPTGELTVHVLAIR